MYTYLFICSFRFFVDNIPIRVYENLTKYGAGYLSKEMFVYGSIWEAKWASGGRGADWSKAPFQAHYREFEINGCEFGRADCFSQNQTFWWNAREYWTLNHQQKRSYEKVKKLFLYDDYCSKKGRDKKECQLIH